MRKKSTKGLPDWRPIESTKILAGGDGEGSTGGGDDGGTPPGGPPPPIA